MDLKTCNSVVSNSINTCSDTATVGFENEAMYINAADVLSTSFDSGTSTVSSIVLAPTKVGYVLTAKGNEPFKGTKIEGELKPYGESWKKTVMFTCLGFTVASATIVKSLADGVGGIVIMKQKGAVHPDKYVVFGIESALRFSATKFEMYADAGGFELTGTELLGRAPALFLNAGTEELTDALYETLLGNV